jgi:hypothetical protein
MIYRHRGSTSCRKPSTPTLIDNGDRLLDLHCCENHVCHTAAIRLVCWRAMSSYLAGAAFRLAAEAATTGVARGCPFNVAGVCFTGFRRLSAHGLGYSAARRGTPSGTEEA